MAEIASAFVTIAPSAKGFGASLSSQVRGGVTSTGKSMGAMFGKMFVLGSAVIAAAGVGQFLKGSIAEAREAQQVGAQTAAVLKSTGGAAKITADQVGKMATRLSGFTGIDDEAIQSGENLLLTFTNIRNEVGGKFTGTFDSATQVMTDMSVALGQDMKSSAIQVGKALNDPIKGVTALQRVGVSFTQQQKDQIKTLVDSGKTTTAQRLILHELTKEFGGSAEAQATAGQKASVAFGNIEEAVGTALLPALDSVENAFVRMAPAIQTGLVNGISKIGPLFRQAQAFLAPFVAQVTAFFQGSGGSAIQAFATQTAASLKTNFLPVLQTMALTFQTKILPAVFAVGSYFAAKLLPILVQLGGIIRGQVLPIMASLATFLYGQAYPAVIQIATVVAKNLKPAFDQLFVTFQTQVLPAVKQLLAAFQRAQPTIQKVVLFVLKLIGVSLKMQSSILGKVLPVLIRFAGFLISTQVKALIAVGTAIGQVIVKLIAFGRSVADAIQDAARFAQAVKQKISDAAHFISGIPGKVKAALGNVGSLLFNAGEEIINGLIRGVESKIGSLTSKLHSLTNLIPKVKGPPAKDKKLLYGAGQLIMGGLIDGIASKERALADHLDKVGQKIGQKLQDRLAKVKDALTQARSDFASLVEPIASNFTQGLFDFDTASAFTANLATVKGTLTTLMGNFKKLLAEGLSPGFLYQLFQSGGPALINSLAALDKASAQQAGATFGQVMNLSNQLGTAVAGATDKGGSLEHQTAVLERRLKAIEKAIKNVGHDVGDRVNGAASNGHRRAA